MESLRHCRYMSAKGAAQSIFIRLQSVGGFFKFLIHIVPASTTHICPFVFGLTTASSQCGLRLSVIRFGFLVVSRYQFRMAHAERSAAFLFGSDRRSES